MVLGYDHLSEEELDRRLEANGERNRTHADRLHLEADADFRAAASAVVLARLRGGTRRGIFANCKLGDLAILAAGHGPGDFPLLLSNALHKSVLDAYANAVATPRLLSREVELGSFRAEKILALGDFPTLARVIEGAEIKSGTLTESGEELLLLRFGLILSFSGEAAVNDDIGALLDVGERAVNAALECDAGLFFAMLLANAGAGPTMADGLAMFHATHNNMMSGGALSASTLGLAMAALREQTSPGGAILNTPARYILVPAGSEVTARTLARDVTTGTGAPLEVLADGHVSSGFYIFGDPASRPTFVRARLRGHVGPTVIARESFESFATEFKMSYNTGFAPADYRGAVWTPAS